MLSELCFSYDASVYVVLFDEVFEFNFYGVYAVNVKLKSVCSVDVGRGWWWWG